LKKQDALLNITFFWWFSWSQVGAGVDFLRIRLCEALFNAIGARRRWPGAPDDGREWLDEGLMALREALLTCPRETQPF
jgi:hypothetical protein